MSTWDDLRIDEKISSILDVNFKSGHHFKRPFLTAFQIAITFERRFPSEFTRIGIPLGGKGIGLHHSFSKYLANILSRRIKNGSIRNIEGRFLLDSKLSINARGQRGTSLKTTSAGALSIFRLKDRPR